MTFNRLSQNESDFLEFLIFTRQELKKSNRRNDSLRLSRHILMRHLGSQKVDPGPIRSKDNGLVIYDRDSNKSDGDLQISLDLVVMKLFYK